MIGKLCIEEVRVDLEHLCSCSRKQCRIFHGSFSVNNYPLVYINCIIKIMCQALVLGWLDCLFTMCRTKTETLAIVRDFTFFTGKLNGSEIFCTLLMYKFLKFSNLFHNFLSYKSIRLIQILLQTVPFLTDSVFYVLFACFDESMASIRGYEP